MDCLIRRHDDHQFEVKVVYPLQREAAEDRYALDMFVFLPYQLGVNEFTWTREGFYEDLRAYTRFKTPVLSLEEVNDAQNALSPLTRVERHVEGARTDGRWDAQHLRYELRVLANVVKVRVRDGTAAIRLRLRNRDHEVPAAIARLLSDLGTTLHRFRELRRAFESPNAPADIRAVYQAVDEHVSIETEKLLLRFLKALMKEGADLPLDASKQQLTAAIAAETAHRRACGYPTIVSRDPRRNEQFLYREGLLKKFCQSVLFLSEAPLPGAGRARQLLYAVAAAIAMTFTVVAAWVVGRYYPTNSLGFAVAVIIAYAFKDRFKFYLQNGSSRIMPRWMSDRSAKLTDPQYGMEVGRTRENLTWPAREKLPEDIRKARRYQDSLERAVAEPTEIALHYAKKVRIKTRTIYASHQRSVAIDEILRVQVGRWLEMMDDPRRRLLRLRRSGAPASVLAARVYEVPLMIRLTSYRDGAVTFVKALLVLSRNGIERIETQPTEKEQET